MRLNALGWCVIGAFAALSGCTCIDPNEFQNFSCDGSADCGAGGGTATGRPIRAVQVGGPLGAYIPTKDFDTAVDYEALAGIGAMLGHGGIVVFDDTVDMARMARYAMEFCAIESCGKCTPCRIGSTRGVEVIDRILAGVDGERNVRLLEELCETMVQGSLCGLGGMAPFPVQSALKHFREDFRARV